MLFNLKIWDAFVHDLGARFKFLESQNCVSTSALLQLMFHVWQPRHKQQGLQIGSASLPTTRNINGAWSVKHAPPKRKCSPATTQTTRAPNRERQLANYTRHKWSLVCNTCPTKTEVLSSHDTNNKGSKSRAPACQLHAT